MFVSNFKTRPLFNKRLLIVLHCIYMMGCNISDATDVESSSEGKIFDTKLIESQQGAVLVYRGAIFQFNKLVTKQISSVAKFTDELTLRPARRQEPLDSRVSTQEFVAESDLFVYSQTAKVQLEQAIQLLSKYYESTSSSNMIAHAYGLLGMVHLIIADNFCSGFPISESRWGGDFIAGSGLPKDSIYYRALNYFNKGIALNPDSTPVITLLQGGRARALTSLGDIENAYRASGSIRDEDSVWMNIHAKPVVGVVAMNLLSRSLDTTAYILSNYKGLNGLRWVSEDSLNQDGRILLKERLPDPIPMALLEDRRIALFSGSEARLIEAEYHLTIGNTHEFINKINQVRRLYKNSSGNINNDIPDPGTKEARENLLFKERAFTFYMSGRRLGDMRRLVSQYGRDPSTVFPVGLSHGNEVLEYGSNYVFVPEDVNSSNAREALNNPNYNSCDSYEP